MKSSWIYFVSDKCRRWTIEIYFPNMWFAFSTTNVSSLCISFRWTWLHQWKTINLMVPKRSHTSFWFHFIFKTKQFIFTHSALIIPYFLILFVKLINLIYKPIFSNKRSFHSPTFCNPILVRRHRKSISSYRFWRNLFINSLLS